jgi:hypothetical protein
VSYASAQESNFLAQASRWIAETGEILALIRYSHAAGSKDFEFFSSADAFRDRLNGLAPRTCITVFRKRQLPLRGTVNDDFIRQALQLIPENQEYLIVGLERVTYGTQSWHPKAAGESHEELADDLRDFQGNPVAVGPYPPWLEDNDEVVSAVIPNSDGSVTTGVY